MTTKNGGPAFPIQKAITLIDPENKQDPVVIPGGWHPGMSLRDWFAGMAMQSILTLNQKLAQSSPRTIAKDAYDIADAMLAELEAR